MIWDKERIESILPQCQPFLFIDDVMEAEEGRRVVAKKYLDPKADFFKGHFPSNPVMTGVLIVEAMAQASIVNVTFKSPAYPGDTLILEAVNFKIVDFGGAIDVTARVEEK